MFHKPKPKKKVINHLHAKKRAKERYGIDLDKKIHKAIVDMIQAGEAIFLGRQTNSRTMWIVDIKGIQMRVLYDNNQHNLVTVLPPIIEDWEGVSL